uniref:hypothetical protein n=1 Tax=Brachyspira sp. TaxID=1977261 RepID=UPI00263A02B3
YIYNFNKKEKKLFYKEERISQKYDYNDDEYYNNIETSKIYYDINGNSYKNYSDENMEPNSLYEITNNRFGESFYYGVVEEHQYGDITTYTYGYDIPASRDINFSKSDKDNTNYINKAYKYSLTQDEIINKNSTGIYLLKTKNIYYDEEITRILCFQNEYYDGSYSDEGVKNYNNYGNIEFVYNPEFYYTSTIAKYLVLPKCWETNDVLYLKEYKYKITNYLDLKSKQIIKKDYSTVTSDYLDYLNSISKSKSTKTYIYLKNFYDEQRDIKNNVKKYKNTELIGFIPLEIFEYYLQ